MLTNNYPGVKVRPHQSLVLSGEAQRIIMAGGGSSWQDLALYLIARFVGLKEAIEVARVYMLQWHDLGQQPFASLDVFSPDARCNYQQMPGMGGAELQGAFACRCHDRSLGPCRAHLHAALRRSQPE